MRALAVIGVGVVLGLGAVGAFWTANRPPAVVIDPEDAGQVALGRDVYAAHCAACHGASLEGEENWRRRNPDGTFPAPPHDDEGHTWHHSDRFLFDYTKQGGQAMIGDLGLSAMPGFGGTLSDAEIAAVLSFIQSRWSARARAAQARISADADEAM